MRHPRQARARGRWLVFALCLPALAVPFVHFTYDTSPLQAVQTLWPTAPIRFDDDLMLLLIACAFFISFPLAGWMLRRLLCPTPPGKIERIGGWVISLLCVTLVAAMLAMVAKNAAPDLVWPPHRDDAMIGSMLLGGFGIAALGVWGAIRERGDIRRAIETLMISVYLANAWVCLIGFHEDPDLGYWLTLPPAGALLMHLIRRSFWRANAL